MVKLNLAIVFQYCIEAAVRTFEAPKKLILWGVVCDFEFNRSVTIRIYSTHGDSINLELHEDGKRYRSRKDSVQRGDSKCKVIDLNILSLLY